MKAFSVVGVVLLMFLLLPQVVYVILFNVSFLIGFMYGLVTTLTA